MSDTEKRYTYEEMLKHPSLKKVTGRYERTATPGVFKYIGKCGVKFGIDFYDPSGRQHREMIGTFGEAKEELAKKRTLAKQGIVINKRITFREVAQKYARLQAGKPSFENSQKYFLGYWKKNERKEEEWHDMILSKHFGDYRLCRIGPLDIEAFKRARSETPTKSKKVRTGTTLNRELEFLRLVLNKGKEWGYLAENPFSRFHKSIMEPEDHGRVRYLTEDEIKVLLAASPPYLKAIIQAGLMTGLRKGDLLRLKWEDVDLEKGILFFNEQKKRGKRTVKVLNSDMLALLQGIPAKNDGYIFHGPDGRPLKDCQRSFRTALKKAGIKDFHFHDLRHTSASWMVMKGASMKAVQEHLGHSNLSMTERYSHLSPAFQKSEVERLNGVFTERLNNEILMRSDGKLENGQQVMTEVTA